MKLYTFILVKIIVVTMSRGIEISPKLQKNILKFGYGINYKYEGMLAHLFHRFYSHKIYVTINGRYKIF